jgi:hypothetical protein
MSKIDALQQMEKAVIDGTALPASILNTQQANRFIDLVVDESVLLKQVRVARIDHPAGEINKLDLGTIVTEDASLSVTTNTPSESTVTYNTVKYRSSFDLASDFTEDNIEGAGVRDTLLNMFSKRIATDAEIAAIEGDDSLGTGTAELNLLSANDGWFKLLTADVPVAQQINAAGASASRKLFYDMKRAIPRRYRISRPDYRYLSPTSVADKWELDEGELNTGSEGQVATRQTGSVGRSPFGIPMSEVNLFPEDLTFGTAVTDASKIVLTPFANLIWFIQRKITIEWDRVPRQDKWEVTIHFRTDVEVENDDMVVMANNVSESGTDYA